MHGEKPTTRVKDRGRAQQKRLREEKRALVRGRVNWGGEKGVQKESREVKCA